MGRRGGVLCPPYYHSKYASDYHVSGHQVAPIKDTQKGTHRGAPTIIAVHVQMVF